jgi:two-component system sensor histidine kinase/response regulator
MTVLVIDDNAQNRALAKAALEDEGFTVTLAKDGDEGIAMFQSERPACILMDVRMPGKDGIAACREIRALPGGTDVAIVFITAQRDVATFDGALAAGGDDFITKPYRPDDLIVRVQTALRLRRLAGERDDLAAEIKQQRDQLQRLQLQKEQLVAFLVHDLKNPVATIELQTQRVLRDPQLTERAKDAATAIRTEARALLRMILDLLDLAKADEGRLAPAARMIESHTFLRAVVDELAALATAAAVSVTVDAGAADVNADPDLLHRVLVNLVENGIRHAPEGSDIAITLRTTDGGREIRVTDAGAGIPLELREHVFDRFASGSAPGTRTNRGLGLAFCKLAIEVHGGRIWIEDAAPGAVFCMFLPT